MHPHPSIHFSAYEFTADDYAVVDACAAMLDRLRNSSSCRADQAHAASVAIDLLEQLPRVSTGPSLSIFVIGPLRRIAAYQVRHTWTFDARSGMVSIDSSGEFWLPNSQADSYYRTDWSAGITKRPVHLRDHAVPPFDDPWLPLAVELGRIDFADRGYSMSYKFDECS